MNLIAKTILMGVMLAIGFTACNADLQQNVPPSASDPPTEGENAQQRAVDVIRHYYDAINRQDYQSAYADWGDQGAASQQSFEQFKQGFANTDSVQVEIGGPGVLEGAAGSSYITIPATIIARTVDGTTQRFQGSYTLRRINDVPGSTPEERMWHLYSAKISQVN